MAGRAVFCLLLLLLAAPPAQAGAMQSDCRRPGSIGTAYMPADGSGTITVMLRSLEGGGSVLVYKRDDPNYARMLSHLGGLRPGEHKPVPPFC